MTDLPASPFIDRRNEGYYIAGIRISLASIAYAIRRGQTVDEILEDFPLIPSRETLEGVVAYYHAHPSEIDAYLQAREKRWEDAAAKANPPEFMERIRKYRLERNRKSA